MEGPISNASAIAGSYNGWLVVLSVALAMLASFAALDLAGRVTAARGSVRAIWLSCGAVAMGIGIWSMHYIGMLAYRLPIQVAYDWPTVAVSLLAAIAASALALAIVSRPRLSSPLVVAGGGAMGLGIASMHYVGMEAMRMPAMCVYDPRIVALSVAIAIGVSIVALRLAFHFRTEKRSFTRKKLLGAAVMGSAIPLMHYCGMAAVSFVPAAAPEGSAQSLVISTVELTNIVAIATLVLSVAIITSFADRRFSAQLFELESKQKRLHAVSGESWIRGQRIEALARVAREAEPLSYDDRAAAILRIATSSMRPGRPTVGLLSHLDRGTIVIDCSETAFGTSDDAFDRVMTILYAGNTFVLERTMHGAIYEAGKALAWNTTESHVDGSHNSIGEEFGIRSLIGTAVRVGSKVRFVVFEFLEPMADDPFTEEDLAFVDVVAAFLANGYQRQLQADRLTYQMEHDAMTGLGNRVQMRRATAACVAARDNFCVAVLNLDRFREINVTYGQLIGDELLVEVATSLADVDDRDLVSRRNGDEFAILMRGASLDDVERRLDRYRAVFTVPFHTGDRDGTRMLSVGCSFGAALFPRDGTTIEAIMIRAELALDAIKQRGGGALIFNAQMEDTLVRKWLDRGEIERALANGEFELHYQPTFDLATREIVGAEGLIRWNHPTRGIVMPGEFIDFAERNGLIRAITVWVFERLVRDLLSTTALSDRVRCYVNVPAQQLDDPAFAALVHEQLLAQPQLARHIGFEITETGMMLNIRSSIAALEAFRNEGISIAIDDFGTGFSSLSYLKHLPADVIKIDQSFVGGIPHDVKDMTLADSFIWLANAFHFVTLAEGIETEEQAAWLTEHGCRKGQGFLVSRALPFENFAALLARTAMEPVL